MKADIDLIKKKVGEAEILEALILLEKSIENTEYGDAVVLLEGRYNRLMKSSKLGIIDNDELDSEMNKISLSILEMLKMLKSDFISKEMNVDPHLHFFESSFTEYPAYNERVYSQNFENEKTRAVGWELRCLFSTLEFPVTIGGRWRVLKPGSTYTSDYNGDFTIPAQWGSFWLQRTYGYLETGKWVKGTYTVEVYIGDNLVGRGSFTII